MKISFTLIILSLVLSSTESHAERCSHNKKKAGLCSGSSSAPTPPAVNPPTVTPPSQVPSAPTPAANALVFSQSQRVEYIVETDADIVVRAGVKLTGVFKFYSNSAIFIEDGASLDGDSLIIQSKRGLFVGRNVSLSGGTVGHACRESLNCPLMIGAGSSVEASEGISLGGTDITITGTSFRSGSTHIAAYKPGSPVLSITNSLFSVVNKRVKTTSRSGGKGCDQYESGEIISANSNHWGSVGPDGRQRILRPCHYSVLKLATGNLNERLSYQIPSYRLDGHIYTSTMSPLVNRGRVDLSGTTMELDSRIDEAQILRDIVVYSENATNLGPFAPHHRRQYNWFEGTVQ